MVAVVIDIGWRLAAVILLVAFMAVIAAYGSYERDK
jgi:hypothetical protein